MQYLLFSFQNGVLRRRRNCIDRRSFRRRCRRRRCRRRRPRRRCRCCRKRRIIQTQEVVISHQQISVELPPSEGLRWRRCDAASNGK